MTELIIKGLLWFSALGAGLIAGIFFAFSTFIMTALGRIDQASGIAAMNAINSTILQSLFMPLFFGTTMTSLALAVTALVRWGQPGALLMLTAGLIYFVGMFLCTALFNVPLNSTLAAAGSVHCRRGARLGELPAGLDVLEPRANDRRPHRQCALHCGLASSGGAWLKRAHASRDDAMRRLSSRTLPGLAFRLLARQFSRMLTACRIRCCKSSAERSTEPRTLSNSSGIRTTSTPSVISRAASCAFSTIEESRFW